MTAGSVVDFNSYKRVQTFMRDHSYMIIPTSPTGQEYLTELGRHREAYGAISVYLCAFEGSGGISRGISYLDLHFGPWY